MTFPFGLLVLQINTPLTIEQMATMFETIWNPGLDGKAKQRCKGQPHVSPFVGYGSTAVGTTYFQWKIWAYVMVVILGIKTNVFLTTIKIQIIQRIGMETHIVFVENRYPFAVERASHRVQNLLAVSLPLQKNIAL